MSRNAGGFGGWKQRHPVRLLYEDGVHERKETSEARCHAEHGTCCTSTGTALRRGVRILQLKLGTTQLGPLAVLRVQDRVNFAADEKSDGS